MCRTKRSFRKKGNMLSGVIGRHQIRDDRRYIPRRKTHMTEFVEEDFYTYRIKNHATKKTTLADAICETSKEELRRMVLTQTQVEQQETYSAYEKRSQTSYIRVEEDVVDTRTKKKKNKRIWLVGLGICSILVGAIVYGSKKQIIMGIINLMSGVGAKGFAFTGGVVSPSYCKKKLSRKLVVRINNLVYYEKEQKKQSVIP